MQRALVFVGIGALVVSIGGYYAAQYARVPSGGERGMIETMADTLALTSTVFEHEGMIPPRFTCDPPAIGGREHPPLFISGVPEGTLSLALIMEDPDVPRQVRPDTVFDHWVVFNIPPTTREMLSDKEVGTIGVNSAGENAYIGPCPPREYEPSEHRYFFRLYALDAELALSGSASKADVLAEMEGHILAQTELMGRYKRQ